jgi:hypothetical protein
MRRSFVAIALVQVAAVTAVGAQASRSIAEGVFVIERASKPTVGWIDLGADVLVVAGGSEMVAPDLLQQIRTAGSRSAASSHRTAGRTPRPRASSRWPRRLAGSPGASAGRAR